MKISFESGSRWLFTGDSITDYRRRKDPEELGYGYVRMIRQWLSGRGCAPIVLNRGLSGNTIRLLSARLEIDLLDLNPDMVSICIGVNDVGHLFNPARKTDGVPLDEFRAIYAKLLSRVRLKLPHCKIVLCEPCGIWAPHPPEESALIRQYLPVIHELAASHDALTVVNLHEAFENSIQQKPDIDWTVDGIHPSPAGDLLIAETWLRSVGLIGAPTR